MAWFNSNGKAAGINTPEKRGKGVTAWEKQAGQEATPFTQRWLKGVDRVTISEIKPQQCSASTRIGVHVKPE